MLLSTRFLLLFTVVVEVYRLQQDKVGSRELLHYLYYFRLKHLKHHLVNVVVTDLKL